MRTKGQIEKEVEQIEQQQVQFAQQVQQLSAQIQQLNGRKNVLLELHDEILKDEGKLKEIVDGTAVATK